MTMRVARSTLTVLALLLAAACARLPENVVVLLDNPGQETGAVALASDGSSTVLDQPLTAVGLVGEDEAATAAIEVSRATALREFRTAFFAQPREPITYQLYFPLGGARLLPSSQAVVPEIVSIARNRPHVDMTIIGHTDRVGPAALNAVLSRDRAAEVRAILVGEGVDPAVLEVTSHGEGNPLIPTADEVPEPRNRRVEVTIR
jgi:outer membrane protein OmpA-like peptidoglycan-associated protein